MAAEDDKFPDRTSGYIQSFSIDEASVKITTGQFHNGNLGRLDIDFGTQGTVENHLYHALSSAISIGLQGGIPLEKFVDEFVGYEIKPRGRVKGSAEIKYAKSVLDLVFRELAISYLERKDLAFIERIENEVSGENENDISTAENRINIRQTSTLAAMATEQLGFVIDELESRKPNNPDGLLFVEQAIIALRNILVLLHDLQEHLKDLQSANALVLMPETQSRLTTIRHRVEEFLNTNREVVEDGARMSIAATFTGIFAAAGANMVIATPVILATFGGKRVVEVLRSFAKDSTSG